jgi:hypothetical protein
MTERPPGPGEPEPSEPGEERRRRRRMQPEDYETELHYGEANRRRAREFLGLSESAVADRPGRRWARGDEPTTGGYRPDDLTGEMPVPADMFGVAAESPGVASQPLAPWMTGEHQAISLDEAAMPVDGMASPVPPAARVLPEPATADDRAAAPPAPPVAPPPAQPPAGPAGWPPPTPAPSRPEAWPPP